MNISYSATFMGTHSAEVLVDNNRLLNKNEDQKIYANETEIKKLIQRIIDGASITELINVFNVEIIDNYEKDRGKIIASISFEKKA